MGILGSKSFRKELEAASMELTVCDLCALIPGQMGKVAVH